MGIKKFPCKIDDVPTIGEFVVSNAERDINDFNGYSSVFTIDYFALVMAKVEVCRELVESSAVTKELKNVMQELYYKAKNFRIKLNVLEGYLRFGSGELDIAVKDVNLKSIRMDIIQGNIEGFLSNMKTLLITVKRNLPALETLGMKPTFIDEIEVQLQEINSLNEKQNALTDKRNKVAVENIDKFNDLWRNIRLILNTAKVIYGGVNEAKLKDYIITQLKKRINKGK
jgi:hypothetical protein